jgi:putative transposase
MPTPVRSPADPTAPAPAAPAPARTPSFVCEVPLRVAPAQERILLARLEAGRQVYNACLGEARTRVRLVRESKAFQRARTLPRDDAARKTLFAQARQQHAFSKYALHAYVQAIGKAWLGEHLDSLTLQKLASRAYGAANRLLLGKAHRVRFKGKYQLDTVEGKNNRSGIRWCQDHVEWKGLVLPARIDPRDPVLAHGLACPVKYVRLVRRKLGLRNRFYVQLVCKGMPYRKPQHVLGTGVVGLDLGPSTIAVVAQQAALLQPFCPEVAPDAQALRRLERQLDRQRHANNPANYDDKGRVKPGKKRWHVSKRQRKVQARRRELHRRLAATRKRSHGQLAHRVLALGDTFQLERLSYRAWQWRYGRSVQVCAPGMFVERLSRLAESAGGTIVAINPRRAKLSQTCHCGLLAAKRLSQRWHTCPCGAGAQRDLFSAHLARFVHPATSLLDAGQAHAAWPGAEPLLQAAYEQAIANQPASGRQLPTSFGRPPAAVLVGAGPSQSGSPAPGRPAKAKSRDAVARRQRRARARQRRR